MKVVSLRPAYTWKCPNCGHRNFNESVPFVCESEEEKREILSHFGIDLSDEINGMDGELLTSPDTVTCTDCFEIFKAVDYRGETLDE